MRRICIAGQRRRRWRRLRFAERRSKSGFRQKTNDAVTATLCGARRASEICVVLVVFPKRRTRSVILSACEGSALQVNDDADGAGFASQSVAVKAVSVKRRTTQLQRRSAAHEGPAKSASSLWSSQKGEREVSS